MKKVDFKKRNSMLEYNKGVIRYGKVLCKLWRSNG